MTHSLAHIQTQHQQRPAYIYIRQSTMTQVYDHQESTRRQYALQHHACQLGWAGTDIILLDADLGASASDPLVTRHGFQKLLADVALGQVGAVFSLEVSRLARQDSEWHRLIEVAALTDTLLIDEVQVYNPRLPDDRLLLGLKGLLSSNELRLMGLRLWENKLRKAQRGQLRLNLPVGLLFDPQQGVCFDPDEQVQAAVHLLFERFRLDGSISGVVRYFRQHDLLFPKRQGGWQSPLRWDVLSSPRVSAILHNPLYAGAYVYGRTTRRPIAKPATRIQQQTVRLSPAEWEVALWDLFPSYISRDEYETNLAQLQKRHAPHRHTGGQRQDGAALLSALALCGRCGQRLHVRYSGRDGKHITYLCNHRQRRYAEPVCQSIPASQVDQIVATMLLDALTPAQIELSLASLAEVERQRHSLAQQWQHRLESARYALRLAERRYEQVDPDNRLVARTLEQRWEAALQDLARRQSDFHRWQNHPSLTLDENQRLSLLALSSDLSQLWHAPTTSWADRKELLSLLVVDVTLIRQETDISGHIHWYTHEVSPFSVPLPPGRGAPPLADDLLQRIRTLSDTLSDAQLAHQLNESGFQTSQAKPFTAQRVQGIRRRYGIRRPPSPSQS
jgi:DNA invertase Pin-like site-specific DNA recombinase